MLPVFPLTRRFQDDRLATIRRHMASAQADSTSQSSSLSATQRRRVGNERTAAEYYRSSNGLRGQTPTYVTPDPRTPTTAGTNTTAAPPGGAAGRLDMDAELGDYGEYLAIHDSSELPSEISLICVQVHVGWWGEGGGRKEATG